MNTNATDPKWSPPYIAFRTLLNLVEKMADGGIPPQIDRSFLTGSEGGKTQVLAALRSLSLIGPNGEIKPVFIDLVKKPDERKRIVRELLERHYPEPVRLGTINATQGQLEAAFKEYGIGGDTMRKAIAFFLRAAEFGDVPTSPNFKTPSVTSKQTGAPKKRTPANVRDPSGTDQKDVDSSGNIPPLHGALVAVLGDLPPKGSGWTQAEKERFKAAWDMLLDYSIPVIEESDQEDEEDEYEEDEEVETTL